MRALSISDEQIFRIRKLLEGLEYGTIVITVHDSNIVQIDRTEKLRFALKPSKIGSPKENNM
ncbi:YezD family protein [Thermoactinomyces mirandus]|uniref:YezD family protein n=1 Tax=Thermoactinomyces mirandus TaxID=2756294 RepID=A0A7W1XSX0_9BACL|nr:YezD family protein [Thermoactinomyces mirandus]MBA4602668.1 YezD family protein [Thermoactinomyces mirandus]